MIALFIACSQLLSERKSFFNNNSGNSKLVASYSSFDKAETKILNDSSVSRLSKLDSKFIVSMIIDLISDKTYVDSNGVLRSTSSKLVIEDTNNRYRLFFDKSIEVDKLKISSSEDVEKILPLLTIYISILEDEILFEAKLDPKYYFVSSSGKISLVNFKGEHSNSEKFINEKLAFSLKEKIRKDRLSISSLMKMIDFKIDESSNQFHNASREIIPGSYTYLNDSKGQKRVYVDEVLFDTQGNIYKFDGSYRRDKEEYSVKVLKDKYYLFNLKDEDELFELDTKSISLDSDKYKIVNEDISLLFAYNSSQLIATLADSKIELENYENGEQASLSLDFSNLKNMNFIDLESIFKNFELNRLIQLQDGNIDRLFIKQLDSNIVEVVGERLIVIEQKGTESPVKSLFVATIEINGDRADMRLSDNIEGTQIISLLSFKAISE